MTPKAVLFDFDGVIADTENFHVAAWQRTLNEFGWEVPDEEAQRSVEIDDRQFLIDVFKKRKVPAGDVIGWVRRKQEITMGLLADSPRIYPGVRPLVRKLASRARLAVVSATWFENVDTVLKATGLATSFEFIVSKEKIYSVKPAPEGYRQALEQMGITAAEAVALEDSPTGLAAARGAGIRVIAVGHRRPRGDWAGDAPFLDDFTDTARALKVLGFT